MKLAFNGVAYDTERALLLARNEHAFCIDSATHGRADVDLYRTPDGLYFTVMVARSALGERVSDPILTPLNADEAIAMYKEMTDRRLDFNDAFPICTRGARDAFLTL